MTTWIWPASGQGGGGGGGAPAPKVAQLMDATLFGGASAAWAPFAALAGSSVVIDVGDYSGNGHDLQPTNPTFQPDLIPGKSAFNPFSQGTGGLGCSTFGNFLGAISVVARVRINPTFHPSGLDAWIFADGRYNDFDTTMSLLSFSASGVVAAAYWRVAGTEHLINSTLEVPRNIDAFVYATRSTPVAGLATVNIGVNVDVQTFAAQPMPTGGFGQSALAAHLGQSPSQGCHPGPVANCLVYAGTELSPAQIEVFRKQAMGL